MAGRKAQTPILSHAFNEKAEAELTRLNSKLHDNLRQDITRIYSDCVFPDLYLLFHSCRIKTHKGLLATRAPNFYKEIVHRGTLNKQKRPFFDTITVRLIESFISEVYTKNVVKHKEDAVVAQIRIVSCSREVESPDSDVFLTPKASPSEPVPKQTKQEATLDDIINRSHFYNLVHIEEDLTRELAEQDALSNSFRSILEKQEQEEESRKPTILDFTKCQEDEYKVKSLTEERAKTLKLINKQYTYTIENEMSREKEEETSLDAHSSGYMTGGSPKEREDVTEVASEIPDDRSSPVSSVTWDSNFPEMKVEETKGNFFIDASSLRDDFDYVPSQPEVKVEEKKLIRRNTFELDPDDDKLAMLREEYEKVNGKEEIPVIALQNDDHSPDSLNCDCTFEEKVKETIKTEPINSSVHSDISNSSELNSSSSKKEESSKNHVAVSDLSLSSEYSLTASPLMSRRRNEFAPILSGGCDIVPEVRPQKTRTKSMNSSWIVDMSNAADSPPLETKERQRSSNSTGFFVPLDDPFPSIDSVISNGSETNHKRNSSSFYIDLKNDSDTESKKKETPQPEKKLFSIFIDLGNGKDNTSPKSKPSSPFIKRKAPNFVDRFSKIDKKSTSTSSDSGLDSVEHPEITKGKSLFDSSLEQPQSISDDSAYSTKRQSFFMFIETEDSPVPRRRTLPGVKHSTNRHSWNAKKSEPEKEHKRSSSISCDNSFDDKKIWQVKPSSELSHFIQNKNEKSRKSVESDENLCSVKSELTDASSNLDRTFVIDEVSKDVNVNTNDLELSTPSHDIVSDFSKDDTETDPAKSSSIEELTPKQTEIQSDVFVKLSDMDTQPRMWKSQEVKSLRMTRSSDGNWFETKMMENSASSRSLSRLFPHLYRKDTEDYSNPSSIQSSINPSPLESSIEGTENSCTSGTSCSRLGEDLLRMFTDEIAPDVTIDVSGRRIKAHKCILSSRCQYFAGMLSGGWVESAGNVISLQGFSYNAVHFALCHIYSGASNIPETINIVELATLADMLCLEGLKEVIMYTLKVKYCHFFHKPCNSGSCVNGVLECLPLAAAYGLDEIYRKSLKWITKYFVRVWPTKGFANLPKELQDKCYKQHIVHLGSENVLDTIMGCEKLESNLTNVKWAQPIINMNLRLHEASIKYLTSHFSSVLSSEAFLKIGKEDVWTMTRLEETLVSISRTLSPDQSCQSYRKIKSLLASIKRDEEIEINWGMEFLDLLTQLETSIEDCLVRQAGRAARTASWAQMDLSLRKKIQEKACLVFTPGPRSSSVNKSDGRSPKLSERPISRPSSGPRSLGNTPILSRSKVQVPNVKRPSTSLVKTNPKPQPKLPQRSASTSNVVAPQPKPSGVPRPKITPKLSNVKSRYLEPKNQRKETEAVTGRRMSGGKQISSSDSSRTSSPATTRVSRPTKPKTPVLPSTSRLVKNTGSDSKRESSEGSGGHQSPSVQVKRTSTFRVATKSSAAKAAQPRNVNQMNNNTQKNLVSTGRSGTFLKDSPNVSKRQTRQL